MSLLCFSNKKKKAVFLSFLTLERFRRQAGLQLLQVMMQILFDETRAGEFKWPPI